MSKIKRTSKQPKVVKEEILASTPPKKRGRPKKWRSEEELKKIELAKKNKKTLAQKQAIKLQIQKQREAAKSKESPKNLDRYYCSNKDLHKKLLVWRNSDINGLKVLKKVNDKLVPTKEDESSEGHEMYESGIQYFVKIPKIIDKLSYSNSSLKEGSNEFTEAKKKYFDLLHSRAMNELDQFVKDGIATSATFSNETRDYIVHDITSIVEKEGWTFNYDVVEERTITNEVGEIMLKIGRKLLNHSNFRNYDAELKEDMLMFGCSKLIRGLKNYNFKFSNPFSWFTQAFWNSFLTSLFKHYKQLNIKKDLMKKLSLELETYSGMDSKSSLNRAIKNYLGEEFLLDS